MFFLRWFVVLIGSLPIGFGLVISGILLGKPMACQDPPTCTPRRHGIETLLLAIGPATSMACGYAFALMSRKRTSAPVRAVPLTPQTHET